MPEHVQKTEGIDVLSDVTITSPANGQVLKYNSSTSQWVNGVDAVGSAASDATTTTKGIATLGAAGGAATFESDAAKAVDANVLHKTTDETFSGTKRGTGQIVASANANNLQFPLKVDNFNGGGSEAVGLLMSVDGDGTAGGVLAPARGKAALAMERTAGFNRGTVHILNNNAADISNPALTDSAIAVTRDKKIGLAGVTNPQASVQLPAGTATALTAPLKFTAGTNMSGAENGAVEYDGTHIYMTIAGTRYQLDQQYTTAIDALVLHKAGAETVTGAKTFNPGTILDKGNRVYDVKSYGAIGDGSVDDSGAVLAAVNAAGTAGGGVVWLGPGTFKWSTFRNFAYGNITIMGAGSGVTTILSDFDTTGFLMAVEGASGVATSNVKFQGISFNLNGKKTGAVEIRGNISSVQSRNFLFDDIEAYGKAASGSGFVAPISVISDGYNSRLGTVNDFVFRHLYIHDGLATDSTNTLNHSVEIHSNSMSNVRWENCRFENTYSSTVSMSSTVNGSALDDSTVRRPFRNWVFDRCSFINTKNNYWGFLQGDIHDGSRLGGEDIQIINCLFDDTNSPWSASNSNTNSWDIRSIALQNTRNLTMRGNIFRRVRTILGLGQSFPVGNEDFNVIMSNNIFDRCWQLADPDGVWTAVYEGNLFFGQERPVLIDSYGRHFPSKYTNNFFVNCCYDPNNTRGTLNGTSSSTVVKLIQGDIFEGNVFYNDKANVPYDYFIVDSNASVANADPTQDSSSYQVYIKNNTFMGLPPKVATLGLRTSRRHYIKDNDGLIESTITVQFNNTNDTVLATPQAVSTTDVIAGNYTASGAPLTNTTKFGGVIDMGSAKITSLASPTASTDAANKAYVDTAVTGLLDFKGSTDASSNPNYPVALKGDVYIVSVAGKIGGASGLSVDVGDAYFAIADNAGGTQATVGTSWDTLEHNLIGALLAANNLSDLTSASTARTNLGLGTLATQNGTFSGTSSGTNTGDQTITLTGGVTGSGTGSFAATVVTNANLTGDITSVGNATTYNNTVPVSKGGTGSTTQNFVDLTTAQTIQGLKTIITNAPTWTTGSTAQMNFGDTNTYFQNNFGGNTVLRSGATVFILNGAGTTMQLQIGGSTKAQIGSNGLYAGSGTAPTSTLQSGGSFATATRTVTTATTLAITDRTLRVNATGATTQTLPDATTCTGREYIIKNVNTGAVTIATTSSQMIDGNTTYTALATQYKCVTVQSNGANWGIIGAY